jgi:hypothetical protein
MRKLERATTHAHVPLRSLVVMPRRHGNCNRDGAVIDGLQLLSIATWFASAKKSCRGKKRLSKMKLP